MGELLDALNPLDDRGTVMSRLARLLGVDLTLSEVEEETGSHVFVSDSAWSGTGRLKR
jgi:hypothetical protein